MGKNHRVILRLLEPATIAQVLGEFTFGVRELAVGTRPVEEGEEALTLFKALLLFRLLVAQLVLHNASLLLLLLVLANVLFQALIDLLDPALDAAEVEGLATLLTVPEVAFLIDGVVANHALL